MNNFPDLLATHGPALGRVAGTYARTPQERDELLQEILLAVWRALPAFRGECAPRTFVLRVAHNQGITWSSRRKPLDAEADAAVDSDVEERLDASARRRRLEAAVRALPDGLRQVVALALEDLSNAEIGSVLGITENNVAVRLTRARAALTLAMNSGGRHG